VRDTPAVLTSEAGMREVATRAADLRVLRPLAQTASLSTGRFEHFQTATRPIHSRWTCLFEARTCFTCAPAMRAGAATPVQGSSI
jgi:hypothetical protein